MGPIAYNTFDLLMLLQWDSNYQALQIMQQMIVNEVA